MGRIQGAAWPAAQSAAALPVLESPLYRLPGERFREGRLSHRKTCLNVGWRAGLGRSGAGDQGRYLPPQELLMRKTQVVMVSTAKTDSLAQPATAKGHIVKASAATVALADP